MRKKPVPTGKDWHSSEWGWYFFLQLEQECPLIGDTDPKSRDDIKDMHDKGSFEKQRPLQLSFAGVYQSYALFMKREGRVENTDYLEDWTPYIRAILILHL